MIESVPSALAKKWRVYFTGVQVAFKKCSVCGKEKHVSEYHSDKSTASGLKSQCKSCRSNQRRKFLIDNREKKREYRAKNREEINRKKRDYYVLNREKEIAKRKQYRLKNGHKVHARNKVHYAVKSGKIIVPEYCELCSCKTETLHGHHEDYNFPLEVMWLCRECHGAVHREESQLL